MSLPRRVAVLSSRFQILILAVTAGSLSNFVLGQSASTADSRPLIAAAWASVARSAAIDDVSLTAAVIRIAGSERESGTAQLSALASGETKIAMEFPSGPREEIVSFSAGVPKAVWSGSDGKQHDISFHNTLTDSGWFAPLLTLARMKDGKTGLKVLSAESVMHDSEPALVFHASGSVPGPNASKHPAWIRQLLEQAADFDLYVNPTTFLPTEMAFNGHPDDNVRQDLPVRVRYSDYRVVNQIQVPFRIRKYVNDTLVLDLQLKTAAFNTGLTPSTFAVQ